MDRSRIKAITLTAMCFALFMAVTDDTVLNVALPQIQTSLGSNVSGLQWILNAYTLPAASLVLTSGTLGDIYGSQAGVFDGSADLHHRLYSLWFCLQFEYFDRRTHTSRHRGCCFNTDFSVYRYMKYLNVCYR